MSPALLASSRNAFNLPIFLAPAFAESCFRRPTVLNPNLRLFSSSASRDKAGSKKKRDANKQRGVSALRSTGTRQKLFVDRFPLPVPAKDAASRPVPYEMNNNHGLYQFFNDKRDTLVPPSEEDAHGRSWTAKELSKKSFYDLWKLHWVCVKEANRISTRDRERFRLKVGYGKAEIAERLETVRGTMKNIRKTLIRRYEDYTNANMVLNQKYLVELFPDAEASLGIHDLSPRNEADVEADQATQDPMKFEKASSEIGQVKTHVTPA